ncbi:MAG: cell envelope integrity protein CreD, partial [Fusobacterium periodonticum]|nr:cell envelope integrity protein CreD [Fusobacterium periodonticum]
MDNNSYKITSNKKPFSPVMKKLIFLVVFVIILQIPLYFVGNLIDNRGRLFNQTVTE